MKQNQASDDKWICKSPPFMGSQSKVAIELSVSNLKLEKRKSRVQNVKIINVLESTDVTVDLKSHVFLSQEGHVHVCAPVTLRFGPKQGCPILMVFIDPAVSGTFMSANSGDKLFEAWWLNMAWNHDGGMYTCSGLAFQLLGFFPTMTR